MLARMPTSIDHVLFAVLAVFFPLRAATFGMKRLERASDEDVPRVRVSMYRQVIAIQWALAIATVAWWLASSRPLAAIGLAVRPNGALVGTLVGVAVVILIVVRQSAAAEAPDEIWERLRRRIGHLERMLPHTARERSWFRAVAVTAGVCEELLYRGYVVWYLQHWMGLLPAIGAAAIVFGIGHLYQGAKGVVQTTLAGIFLGAVYALSGSLLPAMLIHAFMDLHAGEVSAAVFMRDEHRANEEPVT